MNDPTFTLHGQVHPPGFEIAFEADPTLVFMNEFGETLGTLNIRFSGRDITVTCHASAMSADVLDLAFMRASEACQAMIDVAGLRKGLKLFAILDRWSSPDGTGAGLVYADRRLGATMNAFSEDDIEALIEQVLDDLPLRHAITDLLSMLWWPSYAPIACGRVIDSIRRMVSVPETPEKAAWTAMQTALNVDAAYLKFVTDLSRGPRHGHRVEVSGSDSAEMSERTWAVMNRFIAFLRNDRQSLREADFPRLLG